MYFQLGQRFSVTQSPSFFYKNLIYFDIIVICLVWACQRYQLFTNSYQILNRPSTCRQLSTNIIDVNKQRAHYCIYLAFSL